MSMTWSAFQFRAFTAGIARVLHSAPGTLSSADDSWRRRGRQGFSVAAVGAGLWLCARFGQAVEWRAVTQDLQRVGLGAALLLVAPIVGNFVHMLGWRALLPSDMRPGLGRSMAIFLAAQAGNEIGLGVLGESLKVSELPSKHRSVALRAVVVDNLSALAALFAVVCSIAVFLGGQALPRFVAWSAIAALGVMALSSVLLSRLSARPSGGVQGVAFAFLAHYLGKLWIVAEFALALALLGSVTLRSSALLGLVSTVASALGAAIPGQIGVLEAALKGSAAAAGLAARTLVSVALLRRALRVAWVALGAFLFWQLRSKSGRLTRQVSVVNG